MQHPKPQHLMLPGPTPLPPSVLQALASPMLNHRGEIWQELFRELEADIQWMNQTCHDVLLFAGSGSTGMEAALVNLFSPGDRVLALVQGSFSERFAHMAEVYGLDVTRQTYEWGEAIRPEQLEAQLKQDPAYKAVLLVHNETSTGVLNPLPELAKIIKQYEALSIVDAISSLSSAELLTDRWHLDVVITASQKGYLAPPGLSMVTVSPQAWKANQTAALPRYTLDFKLARDYARQAFTPWTPPISVFHALKAAFVLLKAEDLSNIQARHYLLMRAVRAGLEAMGLKLFVSDERIASRSVTPVYPPDGVDSGDILKLMHNNYHITLAAGQRKMAGQIFRIGHLGYQDLPGVLGVLDCLEMSLRQLGHSVHPGSASQAAQESVALS